MKYPFDLTNPKYFLFKYYPIKTISVKRHLVRIYNPEYIMRFRIGIMQCREIYFFSVWNLENAQCLSSSGKFYDLWIEHERRRHFWMCDCIGYRNRKFCSHSDLLKYILMKEEKYSNRVHIDNEQNMYYNLYRI